MEKTRRAAAVYPEDILSPGELEGELTDTIKINLSAIPNYVRDDLAATTLECVKDFLRQPGGREMLDSRIAAKKAAMKGANL